MGVSCPDSIDHHKLIASLCHNTCQHLGPEGKWYLSDVILRTLLVSPWIEGIVLPVSSCEWFDCVLMLGLWQSGLCYTYSHSLYWNAELACWRTVQYSAVRLRVHKPPHVSLDVFSAHVFERRRRLRQIFQQSLASSGVWVSSPDVFFSSSWLRPRNTAAVSSAWNAFESQAALLAALPFTCCLEESH